jgi:ferredoxin
MKRKIITIDNKKCNGCGICIPNCPEGALQIIDEKARLISDLFCDGLGACIGHCPRGAIKVIEREAKPYDEKKVMENIVKQGPNTIKAHLKHLKDHGETKYYNQAVEVLKKKKMAVPNLEEKVPCACPGSAMREIKEKSGESSKDSTGDISSALTQWPVQLNLLPIQAPFFNNADLLIAADCTAFAFGSFHSKLLKGKKLVIGCPKLDDVEHYAEKLTEIIKNNNIKSITVAIMEVPCCGGLAYAAEEALANSGKKIPLIKKVIGISGDILE